MPGGTEYIVHDIDENNYIIGKARFSGHVKVSEQMSVEGFGGHSILDNVKEEENGEDEPEKRNAFLSSLQPGRSKKIGSLYLQP